MFKYILIFLFFFTSLGSLTAQTFIGKINPFPEYTSRSSFVNDTIRILGVMVNFQEDRDGTTFGNGKFGSNYTQNYGSTILDPLPHDNAYFNSHLEFVRNYFSKVSKGQLHIEYLILPDTFSVSQTMRNYSPDPGSDNFTPVGNFAKEVWTIAASMYPDSNFSNYDIFTIFHAGVGRDVSLPGSLGNERDLPSVYLGDKALREIFNNDLTGFPVNRDGKYNSMIIPETESREVESFGGTVLFQLSINGLLVASVASHLGLPDLFNTETGLSAIGRFGLMDGQAIFAYSGTFPPEPSAWEKIYLGWEQPVTVEPGDFNINLVTKNSAVPGDTVILKVPINSSEYFLVENRIRDAFSDGSTVTYVLNGETRTKTFANDTTGFQSSGVDSIAGVVIDVDEYDWAIPNTRSTDEVYDQIHGGGIVIWHIDENVINQKIGENKINVDKENRGVDVEEADGVQDIGERFFTVFGDEIIGEGFAEDFWFANNPSPLFKNRFSKDTRPNTNTNSDANSLITFSNFSPRNNRMSFNVSYGDSLIKPLFVNQIPSENIFDITVSGENENNLFFIRDDENIWVFDHNGGQIQYLVDYSQHKPAAYYDGQYHYLIGVSDSILKTTIIEDINSSLNKTTDVQLTSPPVINLKSNGEKEVLVGTVDGRILVYNLLLDSLKNSISTGTSKAITQIAVNENYWAAVTKWDTHLESDYVDVQGNKFSFDFVEFNIGLTKDKMGNYVSILYDPTELTVIAKGEILFKKTFPVSSSHNGSFAVGDLKNDGENYIIYPELLNLRVINFTGAPADNFPIIERNEFAGSILISDFEGDRKTEIITSTEDGKIYAIDGGSGKNVNGFPISASGGVIKTATLFMNDGKPSLAMIDESGYFKAWNVGSVNNPEETGWVEFFGNGRNTAYLPPAKTNNEVTEFFPEARVYNYPNPVYEGTTFIRYFVSEDAKVNIKIFDLAGSLVDELNDNALGGFDNETEWSVNDIQSGVYLARIEATGLSGKSENKIIKIAVIK